MRMMLPVASGVYFFGIYAVARLLHRVTRKPMFDMQFDVVVTCYGSMIYSFYITIASIAVSLFQCYEHPNGERSLLTFPYITCDSDDWKSMLVVGILGIFFFCVLTLVCIAYILLTAPTKFTDKHFQMRWKFLFIKFRPDIWWWALVVLTKNLFLNFAPIVDSSGFVQMVWLMATILLYLLACALLLPWRSFTATTVDVVMHTNLMFIATLSSHFTDDSFVNEKDLGLAISVLSFAPFLLMGSGICYLIFKRLKPQDDTVHRAEASSIARTLLLISDEDVLTEVLGSMTYIDYHRIKQLEVLLRTDVLRQPTKSWAERRLSYTTKASEVQKCKTDSQTLGVASMELGGASGPLGNDKLKEQASIASLPPLPPETETLLESKPHEPTPKEIRAAGIAFHCEMAYER